ncbi:MAG: hypothetical protein C5B50_12185 [Verrucomicrobia bacterium]|nr:MAG: hypothetical protein C5B50_12185 [Verrucomicrobiota bacterium]
MSLVRLLASGKSLVDVKGPGGRYRMSNPGALPKFGSRKNPFREVEAEGGVQGSGFRSERAEADGGQRAEDGGQRSEDRGRRTEDGGQTEDRVQGSGVGSERVEETYASLESRQENPEGKGSEHELETKTQSSEPRTGLGMVAPDSTKLRRNFKSKRVGPANGGIRAVWSFSSRVLISTARRICDWASKACQLLTGRRVAGLAKAPAARAGVQGELSLEQVRVVCSDLSDADLEVAPILKAEAGGGGNNGRDSRPKIEQQT